MKRLNEAGITLIIFGLSIIIFFVIFDIKSTHKYSESEALPIGIFSIFMGSLILVIKHYVRKYYK